MTHERENNGFSQEFLNEHLEKFNGDNKIVMQLLFSGKRLTARELEKEYDIDGRRLRDCIEARPDLVKREPRMTEDGKKTKWVEYFIPPFKPPTKKELTKYYQQQIDFDKQ